MADKEMIYSEKIYIGNDPDNQKVYLEIRIDKKTGDILTTDLTLIKSALTLSICGEAWLKSGRDCDYCGQIHEYIKKDLPRYKKVINRKAVKELLAIWDEWHLNDLKAGTRYQDLAIKTRFASWAAARDWPTKYDYSNVCEFLKAIGIHKHSKNGLNYVYGHAWLTEPLPANIAARVETLVNEIKKAS